MSKYCSDHPVICEFRLKNGFCNKLNEHEKCDILPSIKHTHYGLNVRYCIMGN